MQKGVKLHIVFHGCSKISEEDGGKGMKCVPKDVSDSAIAKFARDRMVHCGEIYTRSFEMKIGPS